MKKMIPYFKNAYKEVYVDRGMLLTDFILATAVPYIIQILLWSWFFQSADLVYFNGFNYSTLMVYYIFVIAFNRMNNGYGIVEYYSKISHSGSLAALTCKPISLIQQRLVDFLGGSVLYFVPVLCAYIYYILSQGIIGHEIFLIFFKLIIVVCISQVLCFYISYFFSIFTLLVYRPYFLLTLLSAFQVIFGGVLIPSNFWPESIRPIMEYNPFYFTIAAPVEIIMGLNRYSIINYIFASTLYICLIGTSAIFLEKKLSKNSVINGG